MDAVNSSAKRSVLAPVNGQAVPLEQVPDEVFSQKVLGDGLAIIPTDGKIYSPADGEISSVAETKHAYGFTSDGGLEILIHIGIDTVNLKGQYFTAHVKDGDTVKAGQPLVTFELDKVKAAGYDTVIPMVFTDPDHQPDMSGLDITTM